MTDPRTIAIEAYDYPLPAERIAQFPLDVRDRSKLLVLKNGKLSQDIFSGLAGHLPAGSLLVSNETRVIHARLVFHKESGSRIEVFCLEPAEPADLQLAFQQQQSCTWKCLVGNAKRWKQGSLSLKTDIGGTEVTLSAEIAGRSSEAFLVNFSWTPGSFTFTAVLEAFGKIPLPPYIGREAAESDNLTYQTVFARSDGSVAAPTAGLHFTPEVLQSLAQKGIQTATVTLHVGAGTFKPVSTETIGEHQMHSEKVIVPLALLKQILAFKNAGNAVVLVGTTTVRTLESVYWQGVKWLNNLDDGIELNTGQWDPYAKYAGGEVSLSDALQCVTERLEAKGLSELHGATSLMIAPGYRYRIPDAIITNFHQPKSTLLLLVSAFTGPQWKEAYRYALENDFRFLSYGDSCLFFKP